MSHYNDVLGELRYRGQRLANQYIVELYTILSEEEKLSPADCRAKIEHDCLDLCSKATLRKYLPPESKDVKKQKAGSIGAENKKKIKNAMLLITATEDGGARINLAEDDLFSQKERESRDFHEELDQQLSGRKLSPALLEANTIIGDKDIEIEELKKARDDLIREYPTNNTLLFLPNNLAQEIYNAVSLGSLRGFKLEHNGEAILAVYHADS